MVSILVIAVWGCSDQLSTSINNKLKKRSLLKSASKNKFPNLLTILDKQQIPKENKYLSIIQKQPTTIWVHVAHLTNNPTKLLKRDKKIAISVSQSKKFIVIVASVKRHSDGDISWGGRLKNRKGQAGFVLGSDGVTGTLYMDSLHYGFEPIGDGLQAIFKIDQSGYGLD
jgi:hypothetical protein